MDPEELQAEEEQTTPPATPEEGSESAPEEKLSFDDRQQEFINQKIGEKTKVARDAEREAEQLRKDLAEARAQIPTSERPAIPDIPDPFAENYTELVQKRDTAIQAAADFDAEQRVSQDRAQSQIEAQQQAQRDQVTTAVTEYSTRATKLGVSPEELNLAGQAVAEYGLPDEIVHFILGDDSGPLITTYLAKHPVEADSLRGLSPLQAAVKISSDIKSKAVAMKKTPGAPPPADDLGGGGVPPQKRGPVGATYK